MHSIDLAKLNEDEINALYNATKKIKAREKKEIIQNYAFERNDSSTTLELTSKDVNSMIIALDKIIFEDIPEEFNDTPSSGHSGDMSYYYEQVAKEGCRDLMNRLKQLQE
jgi:hypothetical protein